jgi:type II secretory pathway pseudopilin PulG
MSILPMIARAAFRRRAMARRGGSLLELLMLVTVVAIIAAAALPMLSGDAGEQVASAAQTVAADLAYARGLAVANGSSYRITFDSGQNLYRLKHVGTNPSLHTLPDGPMGSPNDPANERIVRFSEFPSLGTRVAIVAIMRSGAQALTPDVEFDSHGSTRDIVETAIWLKAGGGNDVRYLSVRVNPVTGLATVGQAQKTAPAGIVEALGP